VPRTAKKQHTAAEFDLEVLSGDDDMFRWFLLCYLFGKPIRSSTAVDTWRIFVDEKMDTPWAIAAAKDRTLVRLLNRGGYTRYQHVTAHGLQVCMQKLIDMYDGSLFEILESSPDEDAFLKQLQKLYGVGPKVAEIFSREVEEVFARRIERK
jgi:endonuclease III